MNLLKNVFAGVASLAVTLTVALSATPAAAGTPHFTDLAGHWAEGYVTELAEADVISTENADGSAKTMYYPQNSLSRAELTKLAIEAFYGDTVADLADAFADADAPSFTDVPTSAWFFDYVEIAKGLDIVNGIGNGEFAPNSPITRAAALKVLLLTGDIETVLDPATPFTDVASTAWYYEYVTSAYNHCIVNGTSADMFTPNGNITRAEVAKVLKNAIDVANGEDLCSTEEEEETTEEEEETTEEETTEEEEEEITTTVDGVLEVSLSADSPEGSSIPKNGSNVPFLALDLTNTSDEDIEVTGVTVAHGGLGDEAEIGDVKLFEGLTQRGSDRSFTSDEEIAPLNLAADPVVVPAGSTVTVVIAADINTATSGGEHTASVLAAEDIIAVGADSGADVEVTGDFPVEGDTMVIANVDVGTLTFAFQRPSAEPTVEIGETDQEIARLEVTAGAAEDVLLQAITLEFDGVKDGNLTNVYAEFQGERISDIIDVVNGEMATIDFTDNVDGGWMLNDGDSRTLRVKADITSGVEEVLTVKFDEVASDVVATGLTYGFGVGISETGSVATTSRDITINGGDITFTVDSTARDVAPDTNEVEFGVITITNLGEAIELKDGFDLYLYKNTTVSANDTEITDVRLVDTETGATFMGPASVGAAGIVDLNDENVIASGETVTLAIQADIESTAVNADVYYFSLDMDSVEVEGIDSGESDVGGAANAGTYDIKPTADITSKNYTIAAPSVTFTGTTLNADTFVKDAEDVLVWEGTVRANDVEDLYVRSLEFTNGGTATSTDIDDYSIYTKVGSTVTPIETNTDSETSGSVTFPDLDEDGNSGLLVPAGEEIGLIVTANVSSNPTAANTVILSLDVSETDAEDEDGDTATVTNGTDIASATFTLASNGSLAITLDNNSPDAAIVTAGLTDLPVAVYEFSAQDEDVSVEDLMVNITDVDTTATLGSNTANDYQAISSVSLFYYDDGTAVKQTNGNPATASIDTNGEALFQGLDLVIADGDDELIEVRVDLNDMDDQNSSATAESGMTFIADVDPIDAQSDIKGIDSGIVLTVANPTSSADNFYVMNNSVIAEAAANQATSLSSSATQELIKFTLTSSGDNSDAPYLEDLTLNISTTDAGSTTTLAVGTVTLYNDDNTAIGTCTGTTCAITGIADEIEGGSETYRVEAAVTGVSEDDKITTNISINSSAPGADGITWTDGGTDGTDGVDVQWIDLGEADTTTTRIENVVSN